MGPGARHPNTSDYLLAAGRADDVAVVSDGRSLTYGDLRSAGGTLVGVLAGLELPAGSRIGIIGPNSLFWIAAYLAVMKTGHVAVPLSDRLGSAELWRELDFVDCRVVLVDRRSLPRCSFPAGTRVITDAALAGPGGAWPAPDATVPGHDAALMFTSGTTSRPKAVRVTHRNIQANTESIIRYLRLSRADRALVVLPFFYCFGASLLHTHLRVGGGVVLPGSFAFPEVALDLLEQEGCTVLAGVPSTFQLLLRASSFADRPLSSLRLIQQAGGRLAPVLVEEMLRAENRAELFLMYGQTEATARLSYLPPHLVRKKAGSIGTGIPGVELRVLDEGGVPVAVGSTGEIYARGESVSPGYFNDPTGSASRFTAWGLRTGDLATVDEDGYIYIVDRREEFIKSWGHRVSSQQVEACAMRLAEVVEAAAIGVADLEAGEAVVLYVVPRPGASLSSDQVLAACRENLPRYMVPRTVTITDALPVNPNGKVSKSVLREQASGADRRDSHDRSTPVGPGREPWRRSG